MGTRFRTHCKGGVGSGLRHAGTLAAARAAALVALIAATAAPSAQEADRAECREWRGDWNRASFCELRETTLPAAGSLIVDGGRNGGIRVRGSDRDDVLVRATVRAWADDEQEASEIARQVEIRTDGSIRAEGPASGRRASWAVSYEILTPRAVDLTLETHNGGIAIDNVRGDLDFTAVNGGVRLDGVGGDVRGRTTNGGLAITLDGDTWTGEGLDVATTNGGVRLRLPDGYAARLETGTVNGGIDIDFPITLQGRIGRDIATTLGEGGPLLRARTVNGGVAIDRY